MIDPDSRPRLATKARLRFDRHARQHLLLYPERGLALNATATAILELCTGERTVSAIAELLASRYDPRPHAKMVADVCAFLEALARRGVVSDVRGSGAETAQRRDGFHAADRAAGHS